MGKTLAIKGHSTRGKEVIELLEMMGGENSLIISGYKLSGYEPFNLYYINDNGVINYKYHSLNKDMVLFTLEDFLEKFPYKVGDKVHIYVQNDDIDGRYDIDEAEITAMRWNPAIRKIAYKMKNINREFYKEEIKCKVDDSTEQTKVMEEKDKAKAPKLKGEDYSSKRFGYKIPDGYEFDVVVDGKIFLKPIKPKYPTTYEECEKILGLEDSIIEGCIGYEYKLLNAFQKLLMCRDTYWKIAGEQMGLDKPWEPNWTDGKTKYGLTYYTNFLIHSNCVHSNKILVFPSDEMRDAFYENFKYLIGACKELL